MAIFYFSIVFYSEVRFFLNQPTNIISKYFPFGTFNESLANTQHVQYYIDACNDIYFTSKTFPNLIFFDIKNSNATFNFTSNLSYLSSLTTHNSNITFISSSTMMILYSDIQCSNTYSLGAKINFIESLNCLNSKFIGFYQFSNIIKYTGNYSYFQNVYIGKSSSISLANKPRKGLQIDNFINGTEKNLKFSVQSGSDYYSNIICSKQKDFIKYKTINFTDSDSIKVYDIIYHEADQEGNYCIDLNRTDKNKYKENLKICIPTNKDSCPEGYQRHTKFADSFANISSTVDIIILTNKTDTLDLSACHKDVSIKWLYSNISQLNLTIIGTYFQTLTLIGINTHFNNEIYCETVILQNSNVISKFNLFICHFCDVLHYLIECSYIQFIYMVNCNKFIFDFFFDVLQLNFFDIFVEI